jgi:hypothetical protein
MIVSQEEKKEKKKFPIHELVSLSQENAFSIFEFFFSGLSKS